MTTAADYQALTHRYLSGEITPEEMDALNVRLRTDAEARLWFLKMTNLQAGLESLAIEWEQQSSAFNLVNEAIPRIDSGIDASCNGSEHPAASSIVPGTTKPIARRSFPPARNLAVWITALAVSLMVVAVGVRWSLEPPAAFAVIHHTAGADELQTGTSLRGETRRIAAGSVELITGLGARVVIEAPAEFRFENRQKLHLTHGRLAAEVPPAAQGFTVVTPGGDVIDLGTKFGVDVPREGDSEVHVFEGEVIAQATSSTTRQGLRDGEAYRMQTGTGATHNFRSAAFIHPLEFTSLRAALEVGRRAVSDSAAAKLREDPALIAMWDFEFEEQDRPPGNFRMVQGRWPGSRAAEFTRVGDHLKLDVGGDRPWPQLTMTAWVRLDQLGEPYQSLFHTDGWREENQGQVHWMVNKYQTMRLALYGNTLAAEALEPDGFPDSRTSVLPEQGRWIHLATTYDAEAKTVRFYLNGEFDSETRQNVAHLAKLGAARIGNWDRRDRKLSGRVDELAILSRCLTDAEVRELYDAGNPYR
ncbi:MAG: LamG-like jellyroll fold domain-containing protein [Pirellulaceae bacterium]